MEQRSGGGGSVELSASECRDLLATQVVGRVAFVAPDGPRIVPVNYAVVGEGIEFRTTSYSELATYAPGHAVAFEVDALDLEEHRGWSVLVTGRCLRGQEEHGVFASDEADAPRPTPWAGGQRPLVLRVETTHLSGRRVGSGGWHHPETGEQRQRGD